MTTQSIVHVIQENPRIDISPAERFGEIKVLMKHGDFNYQGDVVRERLAKGLYDFDFENDYLLLSGDPNAILMAGSILADKLSNHNKVKNTNDKTVKVLKWNRFSSSYLSIDSYLS